jgi:predicted O-methyltransferase YrrM
MSLEIIYIMLINMNKFYIRDGSISKMKKIISNDGVFSLFKKIFKYHILPFFHLPICFIKVRNVKKTQLGPSGLIDFVSNDCGKILAPMQVRSEIISLLGCVERAKPGVVMEIGTARGGVLFTMSRLIPRDASMISLDLPGGIHGGGYPWWKIPLYESFVSDHQKIDLVRADSHKEETLFKIKKILNGRKIDFLFIDGDHTYDGVKSDFELYSPLVSVGGIVAFHDIAIHPKETGCDVNRFWNEIKDNYNYTEFIEKPEHGWGGIGLIRV